MTEFVCLDPKTYCYRETLGTEKTIRKAKRISLTVQADKKITFESRRQWWMKLWMRCNTGQSSKFHSRQ
ncbi:hypothetical protein B9Z55_021498 [Caenorhabditis nigoni]|uniref:Uncharacterized protein n=1 Tax=Caenorhabditis nigoni TaxID=1611254 RepID=A0A2G5TSD4_9PELO|nr:hypothetical protein B9Z55_021497 [Caenorhabditis nigoni]PIC30159.1 hypothetical protein B9Z55_021498 [Caenorhabditis nigoni]